MIAASEGFVEDDGRSTDAYDLLTINTATSNEYFAEMYAYFRINGIVSDDTCPMTKEVFRKLFNNE